MNLAENANSNQFSIKNYDNTGKKGDDRMIEIDAMATSHIFTEVLEVSIPTRCNS